MSHTITIHFTAESALGIAYLADSDTTEKWWHWLDMDMVTRIGAALQVLVIQLTTHLLYSIHIRQLHEHYIHTLISLLPIPVHNQHVSIFTNISAGNSRQWVTPDTQHTSAMYWFETSHLPLGYLQNELIQSHAKRVQKF